MNATTFTATGAKSDKAVKLDSNVFAVEVKNHDLVSLAYNAYLANSRLSSAKTLTRGEVRGGGKKPWRQKGTGRARFGSTRNPIWRTGGIVFGPTGNENYSINLHAKAKKVALRQALTIKAEAKTVSVIDDIKLKNHKTTDLAKLIEKLKLSRNILVVTDKVSDELSLASRNLSNVKVVLPSSLNVYDIINADNILFTANGLEAVNTKLGVK